MSYYFIISTKKECDVNKCGSILVKDATLLTFSPLNDKYMYYFVFPNELNKKTLVKYENELIDLLRECNEKSLIKMVCFYWNDNINERFDNENVDFDLYESILRNGTMKENIIYKISHDYSEYNKNY